MGAFLFTFPTEIPIKIVYLIKEVCHLSGENEEKMKNSEYLKKYVGSHPDNQMAWYLLGREYTAKEEHQKAEFCFKKAGEVYKVFEEIPSVDFELSHTKHSSLLQQQPQIRRRTRKLMRRTFVLTFILLIWLYIPLQSPSAGASYDAALCQPTIKQRCVEY